uniref:Uncharacterized protein n=1 Tax=Callorhinchus milii TaxID=7868 RepID=A0A4W3JWI2_CALMI
MDLNIRKYLTEAKDNDIKALKTAYELIKMANKELSPLDGSEKFNTDLYILCAEQALQLGLRDMSKDCLHMYFKANIPTNQFLGRAYLCQAQLSVPTSAESTDYLDIAVSYILKTIEFATKQSRYV